MSTWWPEFPYTNFTIHEYDIFLFFVWYKIYCYLLTKTIYSNAHCTLLGSGIICKNAPSTQSISQVMCLSNTQTIIFPIGGLLWQTAWGLLDSAQNDIWLDLHEDITFTLRNAIFSMMFSLHSVCNLKKPSIKCTSLAKGFCKIPDNRRDWWPDTLIIILASAQAIIKVSGHQ